MKNIGTGISRAILTLAVAGMGLALTPRTASADLLFDVDETVVDDTAGACGVVDCTFQADRLNGNYSEILTINADFTFDVSASAFFETYLTALVPSGSGLAGTAEALNSGGYNIYALFTASGSVNPATGVITFSPAGADVSMSIDADQSNTYLAPGTGTGLWTVTDTSGDDELVMSSSTLFSGTGGIVPPTGGWFDLVFSDLLLTAFGDSYYPSLAGVSFLFGTVDGDFNVIPSPPVPGTYTVGGDVSLVFDAPEPATMTLLGLGLLGSAMAARRRRKV